MSEILEILKKSGALLIDDHFVYTSGKHGAIYINKDALYVHTGFASEVGRLLAMQAKGKDIEVVAGPALGGIILSQWTAHHLEKIENREILSVYTEKTADGGQIFTRGYDQIVANKKVFIVEDLVTTGGSVAKVVQSVNAVGGKVILVGVMIDRSPENAPATAESIGAPFFALDRLPVQIFEAIDCKLCQAGVPVNTSVGHGKKFIAAKK